MCPSSDELPKTNEATESAAKGEPKTAPVVEAENPKQDSAGEPAESCSWRPPVLVYTGFSLMTIVFALFIVYSWSGYADRYAQVTEGWTVGHSKMIEITLVKDDKEGLACASDLTFEGGIRCGYTASHRPLAPNELDPSKMLQPFNTIKNELFIASGLWFSKGLREPLPNERFTVVCSYHVVSVAKGMALRWGTKANFDPLKQSVAVGTLTDCVIPQ